jgi:hypothetical protein
VTTPTFAELECG